MSPARAPSAPPELPGFAYVRLLGSGGFADVFLYQQERPRRQVAIKVLLSSMLSPAALTAFDAEADLMAQLSGHPSIVNIFQVGRAPDGRPYLVMQYCPGTNLGVRYKQGPLGVPETLRIGIEISSAVETAHRAGILHRDIKPQNILFTEYNEPQLTDFGIASTVEDAAGSVGGMSLPWSPPESFEDPPQADVTTDVWALGATVYTLLAGRSPFELPGRSNTSTDLLDRIERAALTPTGRVDVPASLERVLATAMGKRPEQRYPSALALARALQQVQSDLGLGVTPISIQGDVVEVADAPDDGDPGTKIRRVRTVTPDLEAPTRTGQSPPRPEPATGPRPAGGGQPSQPAHSVPLTTGDSSGTRLAPELAPVERTQLGARSPWVAVPAPPPVEETVHRPAAEQAAPEPEVPEPSRSRRRVAAFGVVAVVGVGIVAYALATGGAGESPEDVPPAVTAVDGLSEIVPPPTDVVGERVGDQVTFTWTNPEPAPGDAYLWRLLALVDSEQLQRADEPTATVPAQEGQTCIEVFLTRNGKASTEAAKGCL